MKRKLTSAILLLLCHTFIHTRVLNIDSSCLSTLDIKPCKYDQKSISCDHIRENFNLDAISAMVDNRCVNSSLYEFSMHNSSAKRIGNVFQSVSFKLISITNNQNLSTISEKAFAGSQDSLSIINVIENHNLSNSLNNQSPICKWTSLFKAIHYAIVEDNGIVNLTGEVFTDDQDRFHELSYVNLRHNKISRIGSESFVGLNAIKSVNLGQNQIDSVETSAFVLSPNITSAQISIDWNNLDSTSFASNWFAMRSGNTSAKIVIDLSHNNITYLDQTIFENILLHNDIDLILDNNPFQCDCRAKWLIKNRYSYKIKVRADCPDGQYFWVKDEKDFDHC